MFYNAIKAVYPNMKIISSVDVGQFSSPPPAGVISDIHNYPDVPGSLALFNAYDNRARSNPILVGEYATIYDTDTPCCNNQLDNPTLESATAEAVMFLGYERNSDVVVGFSHGALIKSLHDEVDNVALMKHTPNAIVFSYSYYVFQLFAHNYGVQTVPTSSDTKIAPLYWSTTKGSDGTYYVKIVNFNGASSTPVTVVINGSSKTTATLKTLTGPTRDSTNSLTSVTSVQSTTTVTGGGSSGFSFTLSGNYISAVLIV